MQNRTDIRLTWLKNDVKKLSRSPFIQIAHCSSIYSATSFSPVEDVGRIGTGLTSGRTSGQDDVRTTAERTTMSEPYRSSSIRAVG